MSSHRRPAKGKGLSSAAMEAAGMMGSTSGHAAPKQQPRPVSGGTHRVSSTGSNSYRMAQQQRQAAVAANSPAPSSSSRRQHRIHFLQSLAFVRLPSQLSSGEVPVYKVAANGKSQLAFMSLSDDKFTIFLTTQGGRNFFLRPTSEERAIDLGEIDRIQRGQSTQHFEKAKKKAGITSSSPSLSASHSLRRPESISSRNTSNSSAHSMNGGNSTQAASTATIQSLEPERSFSIIFRGAHTLDLMTTTLDARDLLCDALDRLLQAYLQAKTRVANDVLLLRYVWIDVDKDKTGVLNLAHIAKVFDQMNYFVKRGDLKASFEQFGRVLRLDRQQRRDGFTFEQLAEFMHYTKRNTFHVKPVNFLWGELFGESQKTVSSSRFLRKFIKPMQGETKMSHLDVKKLFRKMHDMELSHARSTEGDLDCISLDQFETYLLSDHNRAFDPDREAFNGADMNLPLSEYWINASHNTYLVGDQYMSESLVEMYSNALYRGCRCLELDIWDGHKTSTGMLVPVVWHGHTMTTKIHFVDIIKTIKVFLNFHPDSFPIILSFENHCTIPFQEVMAEQLVRILGRSLFIPAEASLTGQLPSPAALRGMVVIKGRRPLTEAESDDDSDDEAPPSSTRGCDAPSEQPRNKTADTEETVGVAPQLARLTLFHGHKLKNWEESTDAPNHHMHSFSENKVRYICKSKQAAQWIKFNQTHMSRTYPAGSRVDSSNYNPLLAWSMGCQMVALNFQTQDTNLRLNDGRFRENGNCGYVLKPSSLMIGDFEPPTHPLTLTVRVLGGSCIPKQHGDRIGDCISPYVSVSVHDVKGMEKESITTYPTSIVKSNGLFPIWMQGKFTFTVENWAVAMLQLTVLDSNSKDAFIACSSIPISCLRRGIRSVKLYDATNTTSGPFDYARLLVDIKFPQQVAEV